MRPNDCGYRTNCFTTSLGSSKEERKKAVKWVTLSLKDANQMNFRFLDIYFFEFQTTDLAAKFFPGTCLQFSPKRLLYFGEFISQNSLEITPIFYSSKVKTVADSD